MIKSVKIVDPVKSISNVSVVDSNEIDEYTIDQLIISMIVKNLNVISGPAVGINKSIVIIDKSFNAGKNKEVHDPIVLIAPEIIDTSFVKNPVTQEYRLNSLTLRHKTRSFEVIETVFTKNLSTIVNELKKIGVNVNENAKQ